MQVGGAIYRSGLRGTRRGRPSNGLKWSTVAKMPGDHKVVVCMPMRVIRGLHGRQGSGGGIPIRVLEGPMAIAAFAVGAKPRLQFYIRGRIHTGDREACAGRLSRPSAPPAGPEICSIQL